jgi:tetratricopeptide (TPR) repeat protein
MAMIRARNNFDLNLKQRLQPGAGYPFALTVLFAIIAIIYSNSFMTGWHLDDYANIVNNSNVHLHTFSWDTITKTFQGMQSSPDAIKRPLAYFSFALNYFFHGTDVVGYHVVNFLIHYLSAVFLYLLLRSTFQLPRLQMGYANAGSTIALLAVVLWATHPLQMTAVTYIVQRMASLATLFYLMGMYFYVKGRTASTKRGTVVFMVMTALATLGAVACKENAIMLPVSIFLYDLILVRTSRPQSWAKSLMWFILPTGLVLLVAWQLTDVDKILALYKERPFSWQERLLTEPRVIWYYVSLILYPASFRLTLLHDFDISTTLLTPWTTLPAIIALAGVLFAAILATRRKPLMAFAVVFFLLNHAIEGSFVPLELVFEHRNYLPSTFLFVLIAVGIVWLIDYFAYHKGIQALVALSVVLVITAQGHTVYYRNSIWIDELSLWSDNAHKAPGLHRPHHNLGKALLVAGRMEEALVEMQAALAAKPGARVGQKYATHHNLGVYYMHFQEYPEALWHFNKTLEYIPHHPPTYHDMAKIMLYQNRLPEARHYIAQAVKRCRDCLEFYLTQSLILLKTGDADGALTAITHASRLGAGDGRVAYFKGELLRYQNDLQAALFQFERYQAISPDSITATIALVELYYLLDRQAALEGTVMRLIGLVGDSRLDDVLLKFHRETNTLDYARVKTIVQAINHAFDRQAASLELLIEMDEDALGKLGEGTEPGGTLF